jgi:hypothetical protein
MLRNPVLPELRRLGSIALGHIPTLRQRFVDQLAETNLHYEDSPLNARPSGSSKRLSAGERARDVRLDDSDRKAIRLHELLADGRFVMLSVGGARVAVPQDLQGLAAGASVEASDHYQAGHLYLIRPYAYVALSTRVGDVAAHFEKLREFAAV